MNSPEPLKALAKERVTVLKNVRAPLLWLLLPYIGVIFVGRYFRPESLDVQLAFGVVGGILLLLSLKYQANRGLWSLFFIGGISILAWLYVNQVMLQPLEARWVRTERAGEWGLRIERFMGGDSQRNRVSGIASLDQVPGEHLNALLGRKVYFNIKGLEDMPLLKGERIGVVGLLSYVNPATGQFAHYLKNSDVELQITRGKVYALVQEASAFNQWCARMSLLLEDTLKQGSQQKSLNPLKNAYVAMLLGKKSSLEREQKKEFIATGSMHLFAISGLHIGVIAYVLYMFFKLLRLPEFCSALAGLLILYLFVKIIGSPSSAERAFCMIAFYWMAKALNRQSSGWVALIASALFMLLLDPYALYDVGFQLSYLVVASILLFGVPLSDYFLDRYFLNDLTYNPEKERWLAFKDSAWVFVIRLLSFSLAANIICAPLSAYYFGYVSFYGIILNMALIPLASLVIIAGFLSMGFVWLPGISVFLNYGAWVVLYLMDRLVHYGSILPGALISVPEAMTWITIGYIAIIALLLAVFFRKYAYWKANL